jgi:hypothetical protein
LDSKCKVEDINVGINLSYPLNYKKWNIKESEFKGERKKKKVKTYGFHEHKLSSNAFYFFNINLTIMYCSIFLNNKKMILLCVLTFYDEYSFKESLLLHENPLFLM